MNPGFLSHSPLSFHSVQRCASSWLDYVTEEIVGWGDYVTAEITGWGYLLEEV